MHFKYMDKVLEAEARIREKGLDEDEAYLQKLNFGLFPLQLIDYIIVEASPSGVTTVKQRVLQILNQRAGSVTDIRDVIREYVGNLGDGGEDREDEGKDQERQYLLHLVDKF